MALAHSILRPAAGAPERTFLFLHGILGRGQNLRTLAGRVIAAHPQYQAALVDLRAHGGSLTSLGNEDTVENAAKDVAELARTFALPATAILGHSFGGKVALMAARALEEVEDVFVVDSTLGPRTQGVQGLTESVLSALHALEGRSFESRAAFGQALATRGIASGVAAWLTQSTVAEAGHVRFGLDLSRIDALIASYCRTDAWPWVEQPAHRSRVHLIIGERSTAFDREDRERAQARSRTNSRVTTTLLPADHWVHVDDLEGLVETITSKLTLGVGLQGAS